MKKCIVTIINLEYINIFNKFLYFYEKNCSFDLIVYTVNFDFSYKSSDKIKYISYFDSNLLEYEQFKINKFIKNFSDKYKYLVALKPQIVNQSLLLNYDCFLYLDSDCVITPFFDSYYLNFNNVSEKYPLCPIYKEDFMIYNDKGNPFDGINGFDISNALEGRLFKHFNLQQNRTAYRHTFAYFYNKNCQDFFKKADSILFQQDLFCDYSSFFPLLDETVFNFLFWSNNFKKSLGFFPFIDMVLNFKDLDNFENFANKNQIACLHTKFYKKFFDSRALTDFKDLDDEKYKILEKIYAINKNVDIYYNFYLEENFIIFNFIFLSDKIMGIVILDENSNFLYKNISDSYGKFTSYYISIPCEKNAKLRLIFLDEKGSIFYSINENFNN